MVHAIYKVKSFTIVAPYALKVDFTDGSSRQIDFRPALVGEIYGPLRDLKLFEQVTLDREVHTLVWPNGADFDPATLHDWPDDASSWEKRFEQDVAEGRLDKFAEEALQDLHDGRCTDF